MTELTAKIWAAQFNPVWLARPVTVYETLAGALDSTAMPTHHLVLPAGNEVVLYVYWYALLRRTVPPSLILKLPARTSVVLPAVFWHSTDAITKLLPAAKDVARVPIVVSLVPTATDPEVVFAKGATTAWTGGAKGTIPMNRLQTMRKKRLLL